jgi:hypothetical protein
MLRVSKLSLCDRRLCADTVEKVESCKGLNFGENLKRTGIADSYSRSRVAEVAYEFGVRQ